MTYNFKKVLITGGAGTIGLPLIDELISRNISVVVFDLSEQIKRVESFINSKAIKFAGSVLDVAAIRDAMSGCDGVIHLAAHLGVQRTERNRLRCIDINISGTQKVLDACVMNGNIKKIIFASSSEVYGEPLENPISENAITQGKTVYAVTKLAGEELVKAYNAEFPDLNYSILRYFNAYGPHQVSQFVISRFIHRISLGKPPIIYGDGSQKRSYNFSSDTARGTADTLCSEKTDNLIMNLGNRDEPITLIDLANKIIKIANIDSSLNVVIKNTFENTDRDEKREIFQRYCDTSMAKKLINYSSTISLDEGINRILEVDDFHSSWVSSEKQYLID